ncbi:MAG: S8 family serine peptidase, partial [Rhodopirellula sp.]|nr:S8 family serine peptidase [Rhodopirellula sp.]
MMPLFARRSSYSRRRGDAGDCQRIRRRALQFEMLEDRRVLSVAPLGGSPDSGLLAVDVSTYEAARILVRFRDNQAPPQESEILAGSHYGQSFPLISGLREVRLDGGVGVEDALARYRGHPAVLYAEPDYRVQLAAIPADPRFGQLWALHNTGQNGGTPDADIDAPEAWDLAAETGRTIVAVIDSGVDYTHPDLAANMWRNPAEIAGNGIDDDGNGFVDDVYGADFINRDGDPMDDHGHGTHVAGTIAAVHDNGRGVAGVNPSAKIMALKFLDASGSGSLLDAVAALDYAVAHGAQISNNSWGSGQFSQALEDGIRRAQQAGHIVVAAAGNNGSDLDLVASYPASYGLDNVVSVAATDRNDLLAAFSNYSDRSVDLAAPGYAILSTKPGDTYDTSSGTSMAAPHVSGAISLVWDLNPDWDYARVIGQVLATVDPLPGLTDKTASGGRLNAAEALRSDTRGPRVLSSTPNGIVTGSVAGIAFTFNEPIDAATFTIADVTELTGPDGELAATKVAVSGSTATVSFAAQTAPGLYRIVIGPDIDDLAGNAMDQDGDRLAGESGQDAFAAAFTLVDAVAFASADVPLPIQDNASIVSYLDIDEDITISDLDVWLDIDHTWDNDVRFYLVGPGDDLQDHVVLSSFRGGGGDGYRNTRFDDEATLSVTQATAPFTGSYRPEEPLAAFDGRSARGRWALVVQDAVAFDRGDLLGWSLIIQPEDDVSVDPAPGDAGQPNLVTGRATSVVAAGKDWTTVALDRTYRDPVVVATANYGDLEGPAVVRIRNAQNASFDFQVVTPGGGAIDGVGVYYMVVEAGVYNETEHGIRMEAMKYVSDAVDRQGSWRGERRDYRNVYAKPVVFGQVMTAGDDWSVFWSRGDSVREPPSSTALYLGRHVGEDLSAARAAETIGYIVFES